LLNQVVEGIEGIRTGVHICRGNWSRKEEVLLTGNYAPLVSFFESIKVDQLVLEFATPRAGDIAIVGPALRGREIGLGVVNPRTNSAESVGAIVGQVEKALAHFKPSQIFLNPDCGFGCFANRCVNDEATAVAKIANIAAAARLLRQRHE
jgi:methionine synthase II (cobalamin-independent)